MFAGIALTVVAARLDNALIPVGTGEVATAFVLGAVLGTRPFRIGALLVAPTLVYLLIGRPDSWRNPAATLAVYAAFARFNGAAAGAGLTWVGDMAERRKQQRR